MSESKAIWVTRDGRQIAVEDMTDQHLANAIAMLDRQVEELDAMAGTICNSVVDILDYDYADTVVLDQARLALRKRRVLIAERDRRAKGHAAE